MRKVVTFCEEKFIGYSFQKTLQSFEMNVAEPEKIWSQRYLFSRKVGYSGRKSIFSVKRPYFLFEYRHLGLKKGENAAKSCGFAYIILLCFTSQKSASQSELL
jgi:hypothetical protein